MEACTHIAEKVMHTIKAILAFNIPDTSEITIKRNDVFLQDFAWFRSGEIYDLCEYICTDDGSTYPIHRLDSTAVGPQ